MSIQTLETHNAAMPKNGKFHKITEKKSRDEGELRSSSFCHQILLQPYSYITQVPGKNIRAKIQSAFNVWLKISDDKMAIVEDIVRIIHNASLLLDDIQDSSVLRRGIPVANIIYGGATTITSAIYVTNIALEKVLNLGHPDATAVFIQQILDLQRGQGMDIYWRDYFVCPTEEEYNLMVIRKTGGLFLLAIRLMQLYSANKNDFSKLVNILGLSFQIIDDYKNLNSEEYFKSKTYCEDITEGKFSFPIIHAVHSHPEDNEILDILRLRTSDNEIKHRCVTLLTNYGSFEYTREKIASLREQALQEVERLGSNPYMEAVIAHIFKDVL